VEHVCLEESIFDENRLNVEYFIKKALLGGDFFRLFDTYKYIFMKFSTVNPFSSNMDSCLEI
jgi:hypothetical protein